MSLDLNESKIGFIDIKEENAIVYKKYLRRILYEGIKITLTIDDETIEFTVPTNSECVFDLNIEVKNNI